LASRATGAGTLELDLASINFRLERDAEVNRFVLAPFAASVSILAALAAAGSPQGSQSLEDATIAAEPVKLVIRFGDGRSKFHLGEIIPIELEFSSPQRKTYRILVGSQPAKVDEYRIDPAGFRRRDFESVAAGRFHISMHRSWPVDIDPGEKPYKLQDTLNRLFRIPTPGKYRVSVTSRRMGFPVTSNVEELEILPSDPT